MELFHARRQTLSVSVAHLTDRAGRWGMLIADAMLVRSISDHPITLHPSPAQRNEMLFPQHFPERKQNDLAFNHVFNSGIKLFTFNSFSFQLAWY